MLLTGRASADDLSGPIGIVNIIGDTYEGSKEGEWKSLQIKQLK